MRIDLEDLQEFITQCFFTELNILRKLRSTASVKYKFCEMDIYQAKVVAIEAFQELLFKKLKLFFENEIESNDKI